MKFLYRLIPILLPPEGMIRPFQGLKLFLLSRLSQGPVLELGPWVGRSTTHLAAGLRSKNAESKVLSLDIHFDSRKAFEEYFNEDLDETPVWRKERYMKHLVKEEGTLTSMRENLSLRGLTSFVDIRKGFFENYDFGTERFQLIFCDITHDLEEVNKNVPKIKNVLADDYILVCDDVRHQEMYDRISELVRPEETYFDHHMCFLASGIESTRILKRISVGMKKPCAKF